MTPVCYVDICMLTNLWQSAMTCILTCMCMVRHIRIAWNNRSVGLLLVYICETFLSDQTTDVLYNSTNQKSLLNWTLKISKFYLFSSWTMQ